MEKKQKEEIANLITAYTHSIMPLDECIEKLDKILSASTPLNDAGVPSDDEIEIEANKRYPETHNSDLDLRYDVFAEGAIWMRDKLSPAPVSEWVDVKTALPEEGIEYLIYYEQTDAYEVCFYNEETLKFQYLGEPEKLPTHWHILPRIDAPGHTAASPVSKAEEAIEILKELAELYYRTDRAYNNTFNDREGELLHNLEWDEIKELRVKLEYRVVAFVKSLPSVPHPSGVSKSEEAINLLKRAKELVGNPRSQTVAEMNWHRDYAAFVSLLPSVTQSETNTTT